MQDYQKICFKSRGLSHYDTPLCEMCRKVAADVHHIHGRLGKLMLDMFNMIFLCRDCHNKVHAKNTRAIKDQLSIIARHNILTQYGGWKKKLQFR